MVAAPPKSHPIRMTNANPNHYFFSMGSKRKERNAALIDQITRLFGNFEALTQPDSRPISRIYANEALATRPSQSNGQNATAVATSFWAARAPASISQTRPTCPKQLQNAIMASCDAPTSMSSQALNSPVVHKRLAEHSAQSFPALRDASRKGRSMKDVAAQTVLTHGGP